LTRKAEAQNLRCRPATLLPKGSRKTCSASERLAPSNWPNEYAAYFPSAPGFHVEEREDYEQSGHAVLPPSISVALAVIILALAALLGLAWRLSGR
jgi:hypothetical protein